MAWKKSSAQDELSLPRMPGRRLKLGFWLAWTYLKIGVGKTFVRRSPSKRNTSIPWPNNAALSALPDEGRKALGEEAARNIPAIRQKCPEDFDALAQRLATFINA